MSSVEAFDTYSQDQVIVDALDRSEILVPLCAQCGKSSLPASVRCRNCGSADLSWIQVTEGIIHSVTDVHHAPSEDWKDAVPYTVAIIQVRGGARLFGHCPTVNELQIGDGVGLVVGRHGEIPLVEFRPLGEKESR